MTIYVLDSNFFIQAHRIYYPLDVAIGFWKKVHQLAYNGKIISIDKVKNELYENKDKLTQWCRNNLPQNFFKDTSTILEEYKRISKWVYSKKNHYLPKAINEFLDANEADAFLVAYCLADPAKRIVVTEEKSNPEQKNRIKIPDVCNNFNIRWTNTIGMFRELKETF